MFAFLRRLREVLIKFVKVSYCEMDTKTSLNKHNESVLGDSMLRAFVLLESKCKSIRFKLWSNQV